MVKFRKDFDVRMIKIFICGLIWGEKKHEKLVARKLSDKCDFWDCFVRIEKLVDLIIFVESGNSIFNS